MPDINPSIPVVGQPDSTEEPKVVTALTQLVAAVNDVDSAQILDRSVAAVDIENQQAWQTIAMAGFSGNLSYYKDSLGIVHLRGDALTSSSAFGPGTLCTLPAGYRPVSTQFFHILLTDASTGFIPVSITSAGVMANAVVLISARPYTFGHIHFRAEN